MQEVFRFRWGVLLAGLLAVLVCGPPAPSSVHCDAGLAMAGVEEGELAQERPNVQEQLPGVPEHLRAQRWAPMTSLDSMGFSEGTQFDPSGNEAANMGGPRRLVRRQISYPPLDGEQLSPSGLPQLQPQQQAPTQDAQSGIFKFFSDLGPQMERAKMVSSLFGGLAPGQQQAGGAPNGAGPANSQSPFNAVQLMGQLSELIRSTQDRNAKMLESTRRSVEQAGQSANTAASQAQGGIQAALAEIGQGLQRMAANNPNLLPDIKSLYQSVSSKLSSASSSVAQAATPQKNGAEQFAEQLAKAGQ